MGRILDEVIADLPSESQARVTVLSEELHAEVKRLAAHCRNKGVLSASELRDICVAFGWRDDDYVSCRYKGEDR
jgi:hypothetical protein